MYGNRMKIVVVAGGGKGEWWHSEGCKVRITKGEDVWEQLTTFTILIMVAGLKCMPKLSRLCFKSDLYFQ